VVTCDALGQLVLGDSVAISVLREETGILEEQQCSIDGGEWDIPSHGDIEFGRRPGPWMVDE